MLPTRLDPVISLLEGREEAAARAQADAVRAHQEACAAEEGMLTVLAASRGRGGSTAGELTGSELRSERLERDLRGLQDKTRQAAQQDLEARAELHRVHVRLESIRRAAERMRKEAGQAADKAEDREQDDLATLRFGRTA